MDQYIVECWSGPLGSYLHDEAMTKDGVVSDIASGQIENVYRVFRVNVEEHSSSDVSEDIARDVIDVLRAEMSEPTSDLRDFLENQLGALVTYRYGLEAAE